MRFWKEERNCSKFQSFHNCANASPILLQSHYPAPWATYTTDYCFWEESSWSFTISSFHFKWLISPIKSCLRQYWSFYLASRSIVNQDGVRPPKANKPKWRSGKTKKKISAGKSSSSLPLRIAIISTHINSWYCISSTEMYLNQSHPNPTQIIVKRSKSQ